jgi:hypothetical protein
MRNHAHRPPRRPVGNSQVRRLLPHRTRRMIGLFIFGDLIGPDDLAPGSPRSTSPPTPTSDCRYRPTSSTGASSTVTPPARSAAIEPGAVNC